MVFHLTVRLSRLCVRRVTEMDKQRNVYSAHCTTTQLFMLEVESILLLSPNKFDKNYITIYINIAM